MILGREEAKWELIKHKVHASETAWIGTNFDHVLDNNGSMDELYAQVDLIIKSPA